MATFDIQRENHIEDILEDLTRTALSLEHHKATVETLTADRDRLIREAREAGAKITPIVDAAGVNRSMVYRILG